MPTPMSNIVKRPTPPVDSSLSPIMNFLLAEWSSRFRSTIESRRPLVFADPSIHHETQERERSEGQPQSRIVTALPSRIAPDALLERRLRCQRRGLIANFIGAQPVFLPRRLRRA